MTAAACIQLTRVVKCKAEVRGECLRVEGECVRISTYPPHWSLISYRAKRNLPTISEARNTKEDMQLDSERTEE